MLCRQVLAAGAAACVWGSSLLIAPLHAAEHKCSKREVRELVHDFIPAYNEGKLGRLDNVFASEPDFLGYYAAPERTHEQGEDRSTLIEYFRGRRDLRDLLELKVFWIQRERERDGSFDFYFELTRRSEEKAARGYYSGKGNARHTDNGCSLRLWNMTPAKSASQPGRRVALARVTTVVGDRPTSVRVTVPADTTLDLKARLGQKRLRDPKGPNNDIQLEGDGRFVDVVLAADPHQPGSSPQWPIVAGRFSECDEAGCRSKRVINYTGSLSGNEVPAGNYRLYLIADRSPARVTLRFGSELSGHQTLHPDEPASVDLQTPSQSIANDGSNLWSAGSA